MRREEGERRETERGRGRTDRQTDRRIDRQAEARTDREELPTITSKVAGDAATGSVERRTTDCTQ